MITALAASTAAATTSVAAHWGPHFAGGFGWVFLLIPLFWIGFFILLFAFVGRRWRRAGWGPGGFGPGHGGPGGYGPWAAASTRSAEATLSERFAQGDIDEVEYRARLEVLRANRAEPLPPR